MKTTTMAERAMGLPFLLAERAMKTIAGLVGDQRRNKKKRGKTGKVKKRYGHTQKDKSKERERERQERKRRKL